MTWKMILKAPESGEPAPNLVDYEAARAGFSWEAARAELEGLPGGGLNIAWEAVDRQALAGLGEAVALRWLGRNGERRDFTYAGLADHTICEYPAAPKALAVELTRSFRHCPCRFAGLTPLPPRKAGAWSVQEHPW